ncbi:HsdM family class I SAM-dependent methyltransferase [Bariatricus sp. HCP3S3_E12]|uniref:HsdM family class I SAM-dependent methyltransferase n=1 Tax=Bariatricus sp. HCP3S3_E12 TaxID=3438906 RepID=UPI003F89EFFB
MVAATTAYRTQNAKMGCYQSGPTYRKEPRNSAISRCFWAFNYIYACIKDCVLIDPACGSGGMFIQSGDFVNQSGMNANSAMTFYGQEKVEYNAQLCLMNMAVHGLTGVIKSGDEANTFYHDAHNLDGCCDYVMANPPFNVDKVKAESCENAKRLPFGIPGINKNKEVGNGNYLWISYFYSYLNENGRAGFVMASSATDSQGKDKDIREKLVKTGHVDAMISVGNNFFYTKSLPCSLWFFDKGKSEAIKDKVLFIDARNYYTVVDRTLNEWSEWQLKNLNAIVWLYRGETEKYTALLDEYRAVLGNGSFEDILHQLKDELKDLQKHAKLEVDNAGRTDKKRIQAEYDKMIAKKSEEITVAKEAVWLYEKFGDGVYADVLGLCKVADITEIEAKGWSLTPGAYVGVAPVEDDGVDFEERMAEIHRELLSLQAESNDLMDIISQNIKELGI